MKIFIDRLNITNKNVSKKDYGIVFIVYVPNGKISIHQTTRIFKKNKDCLREYFGTNNRGYRRVRNKYWDELKREILVVIPMYSNENESQILLDFWEYYYVNLYDSVNPLIGYNRLKKPFGRYGVTNSMKIKEVALRAAKTRSENETLERKIKRGKSISRSLLKYYKNNYSHFKGKHHKPESNELNRIAHLGIIPSKETIRKIQKSRSWYKHHSSETKKKIGLGNIGKKRTEKVKKAKSKEVKKYLKEHIHPNARFCYSIYTETNKKEMYDSLEDACRKTGVPRKIISRAIESKKEKQGYLFYNSNIKIK